jgi:hypothetical protein
MAGFPSPWIIGWGARFQAGLRDEDASAATPAKIAEAPRSEPGDAAHAALHAAGHISDDEFTLIAGSPILRSRPERSAPAMREALAARSEALAARSEAGDDRAQDQTATT